MSDEHTEKQTCRLEWIECESGQLIRASVINSVELYSGTLRYVRLDKAIVAVMNGQEVIIKKYDVEKVYWMSTDAAEGATAAHMDFQRLKEALVNGWKSNILQVQFEFAEEVIENE